MKHAIIIATLAFHLTTVAQNQTNVVNQQSTNAADQLIELKKSLLSETKDHQQFLEKSTKDYTTALLAEAERHRIYIDKDAERHLKFMLYGPPILATILSAIAALFFKYASKKEFQNVASQMMMDQRKEARTVMESFRSEIEAKVKLAENEVAAIRAVTDEGKNTISECSKTLGNLQNAMKPMAEAYGLMSTMLTALVLSDVNEHGAILLEKAEETAEEFLAKDYIIYLNDEMFRVTSLLLGRVKKTRNNSAAEGLAILERALSQWSVQNRKDPIHKAAIIYNKACYLNIESKFKEDQTQKNRLRLQAMDTLLEACTLDSKNILEAIDDPDVRDIAPDVKTALELKQRKT